MKPYEMDADVVDEVDNMFDAYIEETRTNYKSISSAQRILYLRHLRESTNPNITSLVEPITTTRTKGRPKTTKKQRSTKRDPSAFELPPSQVYSCSPPETVVYEAGPSAPKPMFTSVPRPPKQKVKSYNN